MKKLELDFIPDLICYCKKIHPKLLIEVIQSWGDQSLLENCDQYILFHAKDYDECLIFVKKGILIYKIIDFKIDKPFDVRKL